MANLYGAYKAGRKVMTAAYETNKKRMGGASASSTATLFTGAGEIGGKGAGNMVSSETGNAKNQFRSALQAEKKSFTSELGDALKVKFETFNTGGE